MGFNSGFKGLNCWTSSSDISGYHADFHEGHGTVRAWQERGTAWQRNGMLCVNRPLCSLRHGFLTFFCAMDPFERLVKPTDPFSQNVFKYIKLITPRLRHLALQSILQIVLQGKPIMLK